MRDLFVLTADTDMKAVFEAILRRPEALGIRSIDSYVDRHPWRDPGVFSEGPEFIRRTIPKNDYRHFILAFDHHGSGCKDSGRPSGASPSRATSNKSPLAPTLTLGTQARVSAS